MTPLSIVSGNLLSDNLLLIASILVFAAIMITKLGSRIGTPTLLLFLLLGMFAGEDGLGLEFEDYELAESIGHFAMTIILFAGGLETSLSETKPVIRQGILLSTVGVFLTAALTGVFIYYVAGSYIGVLGSSFMGCFLLAAVILFFNTLVLELLVTRLGAGRMAAKLFTELLFFIISWSVQRTFIFRKGDKNNDRENKTRSRCPAL